MLGIVGVLVVAGALVVATFVEPGSTGRASAQAVAGASVAPRSTSTTPTGDVALSTEPAADDAGGGAGASDAADVPDSLDGSSCEWPATWDDLQDWSTLGCSARKVGSIAAWVLAAALIVYLAGALAFRFVPLSANLGLMGSLRRAREQIPVLQRAYRPRIELNVGSATSTDDGLAASVGELLVHEISTAADLRWLEDRLATDDVAVSVDEIVGGVQPKAAGIGKALGRLFPRQRVAIHLQLHTPTTNRLAMSVELTTGNGRAVDRAMFQIPTTPDGDAVADNYHLVRQVAAWVAYQLHAIWPGELDDPPRPRNTRNSRSYGLFRVGVALAKEGRASDARASYLQAIGDDSQNVGALLGLATLDARDRQRIQLGLDRLRDARRELDKMPDGDERSELLTELLYVKVMLLLTRTQIVLVEPAPIPEQTQFMLDECTIALRGLAGQVNRLLGRFGSIDRTTFEWEEPKLERERDLGESYVRKTLSLALRLATELELTEVIPTNRHRSDEHDLVTDLADGRRLGFAELDSVLRNSISLSPETMYNIACAYARRGLPDEAVQFLREVLIADVGVRDWAFDHEPALQSLWAEWGYKAAVQAEFV